MDYYSLANSEVIRDMVIYGYYVREQIEAYNDRLPTWHMENMVAQSALYVHTCIGFVLYDVGFDGVVPEDEIEAVMSHAAIKGFSVSEIADSLKKLYDVSIEMLDGPSDG